MRVGMLFTLVLVCLAGCAPRSPWGLEDAGIVGGPKGSLVEYIEGGKGEDMILIHGFGSSLYTWRYNWDALARHFHVHAYNTLGVGRSVNHHRKYDLNAYLAQLKGFMDARGIRRAILVGNSMGGQIALAFAGRYPDRVSGFVLLDPSGGKATSKALGASFKKIYYYAGLDFDPVVTPAFVAKILRDVYHNDSLATEEAIRAYSRQWKTAKGRRVLQKVMSEFRCLLPYTLYRINVSAWELKRARKAVHRGLIVWGREDPWFPPEGASEFGKVLEGAVSRVLERAGHLPHVDRPADVNRLIIDTFTRKRGLLRFEKLSRDILKTNLESKDMLLAAYSAQALGALKDETAVGGLLALLVKTKGKRYRQTMKALVSIGPKAVPILLEVLKKRPDAQTCESALGALGLLGDRRAVSLLTALLKDSAHRFRGLAAEALGHIGHPGAVEPLIAACKIEKNSWTRGNILGALGKTGGEKALSFLMKQLEAKTGQYQVIDALELLGKPAVPELLIALKSTRKQVRKRAIKTLSAIRDPRAIGSLIEALDEFSWLSKRALKKIGEPAVGPLIAALKHPRRKVRIQATDALLRLKARRAVAPLVVLAREKDTELRMSALYVLGKLGYPQALDVLLEAASDEKPKVRKIALRALAMIKDRRAVKPLIKALGHKNGYIRRKAAEALGKLGDKRAIAPLMELFRKSKTWTRREAMIALGRLRVRAIIKHVLPILKHKSQWYRKFAVQTLAFIAAPEVVEHLLNALSDKYRWVRAEAEIGLTRILGIYLGSNPATWRKWWERNKVKFQ